LENSQRDRLVLLFREASLLNSATPDRAEGLKFVVKAIFMSPYFIYQTETGSVSEAAGSGRMTKLTQYEVASLLSYAITDEPPDAVLSLSADKGELQTDVQISAQVTRLRGLDSAKEKLVTFVEQLFGVPRLASIRKDPALFPNYKEVHSNLSASFREDIAFLAAQGKMRLVDLVGLNSFAVNSVTADVFGAKGFPSSHVNFVRTTLPESERLGLLTHPAFLAAWSHESESSPIERGKVILNRLLCRSVGAPPANANQIFENLQAPPNATRRQQFDLMLNRPECSACHTSLNGVGFPMDGFDAMGRFRTADKLGALDLKGSLLQRDAETKILAFNGAIELSKLLSNSKEAMQCLSGHTYRFFLSLPSTDGNIDSSSRSEFVSLGAPLDSATESIMKSPNLLLRKK
jgi:Protein of unknown function (DUF1588)/Protein of unknown function (DUF1592)